MDSLSTEAATAGNVLFKLAVLMRWKMVSTSKKKKKLISENTSRNTGWNVNSTPQRLR